jgi:hypothetical protein
MTTLQSHESSGGWESNNTVEVLALVLTVPGAIAALVTLWVLLSHRREKLQGSL